MSPGADPATPGSGSRRAIWSRDARNILTLAWPVFIGQLAVLGFSTIDTLLVARASAVDLAALAVASAAYITVFVGWMGVVMAVSPIVGQLIGAGKPREAGEQLRQALWLALFLSVPGCALLLWPEPFLVLSQADASVAPLIRNYLRALAVALPAALLFTAFRGFSTAVSLPRVVMRLQLMGLACKVPLSWLLVFGAGPPGGAWSVPALGVVGCGIATAITLWCQLALAVWLLRGDSAYAPFDLRGHGLGRPDGALLRSHLKLGIPMGLSILIEVTGFSFMALFIARLGSTWVAGHQIAANLVSLMFMLPLALAQASGTLVAQRVGAGDLQGARAMGWHALVLAGLLSATLGGGVYALRGTILQGYTQEVGVMQAAAPMLAWVALFHAVDALQTVAAFVLRAWHVATVPMVIYAVSLWGIGLGGGHYLSSHPVGGVGGAAAFWAAATAGLALASAALMAWLWWLHRHIDPAIARSPAVRASD